MIILHFDLQPQFKYMNCFIYTSHHLQVYYVSNRHFQSVCVFASAPNKRVRRSCRTPVRYLQRNGPPEILQSDQGTEFKGVVKNMCESLNVRIIKSAAYSPQTHGKDERSHRTWKEKVKFDIVNSDELNWVEYLTEYQKLYSESPHSSLGFLTPFEVYFGRHPNGLKNNLFLGEKKEFEVQGGNYDFNPNVDEIAKQEELCELTDERFVITQKTLEASNNAA